MFTTHRAPDEESLAQRLREGGLRHRPRFSESLHRRIDTHPKVVKNEGLPERSLPGISVLNPSALGAENQYDRVDHQVDAEVNHDGNQSN